MANCEWIWNCRAWVMVGVHRQDKLNALHRATVFSSGPPDLLSARHRLTIRSGGQVQIAQMSAMADVRTALVSMQPYLTAFVLSNFHSKCYPVREVLLIPVNTMYSAHA